jgi:predicted nucleic-acid-binding Zn-ribbon protein
MRERGDKNLPQDMAVAFVRWKRNSLSDASTSYGKYETLVCDACGHTGWFARDFTPDAHADLSAFPRGGPKQCLECEHTEFWEIEDTKERNHHGEPVQLRVVLRGFPDQWLGRFNTYVCRACGWTAWYANELEGLTADRAHGISRRGDAPPCRGCKSPKRWCIDAMRETGDAYVTKLHVHLRLGFFFAEAIGHVATEVCRTCGHTEWFARDYGELRHEPKKGIALLERALRAEAGPYR